jgi:hypothetical protein
MYATKHMVECRCILPQFKNKKNAIFHKFVVFSTLNKEDVVEASYVNCNNCGIVHKIIDLCKSEIQENSDDWQAINIEDIKISLPDSLCSLLESYDCDLPTYQYANWYIDNKIYGKSLIIQKNETEKRIEGKLLFFKSKDQYRIETFYEDKDD